MSVSGKTSPSSRARHANDDDVDVGVGCDGLKSKSSNNLDEDEFHLGVGVDVGRASKPSHPSRSRRKISMPWFRQSSFGMSLARLRLPKQHTIATENLIDEKPKTPEDVDPLPVVVS